MLAAVFAGEGRLVMEDRPTPVITAPDDVLVEVEACGICGSDLQMLNVPPGHPATPGTILGHEMVGRIAAVGEAVTSVAVGTRVIIDPDPKCGSCDPCRAGRPASCLNVVALGVYRDGALASHVLAPAATAHPISDAVPTAIAALAEPLSCVVNGTRKAAARPGQSVLIFGAGAIGCLFLAVFRASGCAPIDRRRAHTGACRRGEGDGRRRGRDPRPAAAGPGRPDARRRRCRHRCGRQPAGDRDRVGRDGRAGSSCSA